MDLHNRELSSRLIDYFFDLALYVVIDLIRKNVAGWIVNGRFAVDKPFNFSYDFFQNIFFGLPYSQGKRRKIHGKNPAEPGDEESDDY